MSKSSSSFLQEAAPILSEKEIETPTFKVDRPKLGDGLQKNIDKSKSSTTIAMHPNTHIEAADTNVTKQQKSGVPPRLQIQ